MVDSFLPTRLTLCLDALLYHICEGCRGIYVTFWAELAKFFTTNRNDGIWCEILRDFMQIIPSYGKKAVAPELPWLQDYVVDLKLLDV